VGNLIRLDEVREKKLAHKAFSLWPQRVGYKPFADDRPMDLPDHVLGSLADLDTPATLALYDLVLAVRGWGCGEQFPYLEPNHKLEALDAFLFLADQLRFELMRRLDWVLGTLGESHSLVEMAADPEDVQFNSDCITPLISPNCHRYAELQSQIRLEPAAAVRSLIPEALHTFRRRISKGE
jgi:hypothetical protein